jgi:hypothetical protein
MMLVLCLSPSSALADDFSAWSRLAPVEIAGASKYKAIFLPPEVYQHALANLGDLRLVDSDGRQVPYYIQRGELVRKQSEVVIASRITDSFEAGYDSYFDFNLFVDENTDPLGNRLVFALPTGIFVKHIEIYGSHDGVKWQYLTRDYIYQVDGREKKEASLGGARKFRYYRIRLLDNVEKLALKGLTLVARKDISNWARYEQVTQMEYEITNLARQTVITLRNPYNLRIKRLVLDIDDNFQRSYSVYSDAKATHQVQTGEIYNLRFAGVDVSGKVIDFKAAVMTHEVIIKIDDRDDRPLAIKGIQAEYYIDKLVFSDMGNTPYRLYFGNAKAEPPKYELGLQRSYIEKENQDECRLLAVEGNQTTSQVELAVRSDYLFNAAIVAVSLLLIIVLVPKLSSRK